MKKPFFLAPMAELSHRALRELIEEFGGCDEYFSEMISAPALLSGGPFEKWYLDNGPCPEKLVYQIVGSDEGQLIKAAELLNRQECAGIDINMGCCAPLIRKTGAGITWMASVEKAGNLIKGLRKVVKRRLSVKIRLGFTENFGYLVEFCRRLEAEGLDMLILHPRTAKEKLKRSARWDYVGALRQEIKIPVAGNGDISSAEDLIFRANGPCDAVMAGRAAVRQPWIFAQARGIGIRGQGSGIREKRGEVSPLASKPTAFTLPPSAGVPPATPPYITPLPPAPCPLPPIQNTGLRFIELLARWQPEEFHVSRARRFFSFFCDNLKWGNYLKNNINRENSLCGIEKIWQNYFNSGHHS